MVERPKFDPLGYLQRIVNPDGTPTPFFFQQWNTLALLTGDIGSGTITVQQDGTDISDDAAALNFADDFFVTAPATGTARVVLGDTFVNHLLSSGQGVILVDTDGALFNMGQGS